MIWQAFGDCRLMPGGWRMHTTARVDRTAMILPGAYIGPNVTILEHCTIGVNAVIGAPGFGYDTDERTGQHTYRPHSEGVLLERHVSVGSNTCIDQGRHRQTVIGEGTKIDNLVHIAHNAQVGRHCLVIAHSMIAGSAVIGDYTRIAPGALIRDWREVGDHCTVGMGSVVVKDVECGVTVAGNPAREL
jgi:UDP-3-O-[3-hydroxymyristoyl] glucosamine N-acyltransferase